MPKMGRKWPVRENGASCAIMYGTYEAFRTNFAGFVPGMVQNGPEKARTGRIGSDWVRLGQVGPEWAKKGQNRPKMGQNRPKMGQKWPARENKASGAILYGIYEAFRRNSAGFPVFFCGKHVFCSKFGYGRPKLRSCAPYGDIARKPRTPHFERGVNAK